MATVTIFINSVEKETAKAIMLNVNVSYNANQPKPRSIWFPKSVVEGMTENTASVKSWFVDKTEQGNAYHGYRMTIEKPF